VEVIISPEIVPGSEVMLRESVEEPESNELLQRWLRCYRGNIYPVCQRDGNEISVYKPDASGKLMHFGSTAICWVNVGFFRLKEN
jgi:hypothetical protein